MTAGAVAVLTLLFGTVAVLAVQTRANGVLRQANNALAIANGRERKANAELGQANLDLAAAKDREAARFGLAMEAIKLFHGEVGDDLVLKAEQFKPLRDKLLKGAAEFYGKLEGLLKGQPDRSSRAAMGDAYFELGELTAKIGDHNTALTVHRKALALRRSLAAEPAADVNSRAAVARSVLARWRFCSARPRTGLRPAPTTKRGVTCWSRCPLSALVPRDAATCSAPSIRRWGESSGARETWPRWRRPTSGRWRS